MDADASCPASATDGSEIPRPVGSNSLRRATGTGLVIGESPALRRVEEQVQQVAPTDSTVLLLGETGTGKETVRDPDPRAERAAQPADGPGQLRGHSGDADRKRAVRPREEAPTPARWRGRSAASRLADRSTIFLDEIGDLPLEVQVKLLRVLEERRSSGSGARGHPRRRAHHRRDPSRSRPADRGGHLPRGSVLSPQRVPDPRAAAARTRATTSRCWCGGSSTSSRPRCKQVDAITPGRMAALQQYSWPGNIRELRNVVERAMIMGTGRRLTIPVPAASTAWPGAA